MSSSRISTLNDWYFLIPYTDYEPLLIVEAQISAANRNYLGIEVGINSTSIIPDWCMAFNFPVDSYIYQETTPYAGSINGSFAFDLTQAIEKAFYASPEDATDILHSVFIKVMDANNTNQISIGNVKFYTYIYSTNTVVDSPDTEQKVATPSATKTANLKLTPILFNDTEHEITATFTNPVASSSLDNGATFTDLNGTEIDNIIFNVNGNTVHIVPANGEYISNKIYRIEFNTMLKSLGQNSLLQSVEKLFYILNKNKYCHY